MSVVEQPMLWSAPGQLFGFQLRQQHHDELFHKDILLLPVAHRMQHMALHMAKYAARFICAPSTADESYRAALVDALVIALASANTLNINLGAATQETHVESPAAHATNRSEPTGHVTFEKLFAAAMGRMAKAAESLDHVEAFPSRQVLSTSTVELAQLVLKQMGAVGLDISTSYFARLEDVERRSAGALTAMSTGGPDGR